MWAHVVRQMLTQAVVFEEKGWWLECARAPQGRDPFLVRHTPGCGFAPGWDAYERQLVDDPPSCRRCFSLLLPPSL